MTLVTTILQVLAVALLVFGVAIAITGRGRGLVDDDPDRADNALPSGRPLVGRDIEDVKFSIALRGYRMDEVDAALDRVVAELDRRDAELAQLRAESGAGPATSPAPTTSATAAATFGAGQEWVEPDPVTGAGVDEVAESVAEHQIGVAPWAGGPAPDDAWNAAAAGTAGDGPADLDATHGAGDDDVADDDGGDDDGAGYDGAGYDGAGYDGAEGGEAGDGGTGLYSGADAADEDQGFDAAAAGTGLDLSDEDEAAVAELEEAGVAVDHAPAAPGAFTAAEPPHTWAAPVATPPTRADAPSPAADPSPPPSGEWGGVIDPADPLGLGGSPATPPWQQPVEPATDDPDPVEQVTGVDSDALRVEPAPIRPDEDGAPA
jgi:DivIVA domain-containing protein